MPANKMETPPIRQASRDEPNIFLCNDKSALCYDGGLLRLKSALWLPIGRSTLALPFYVIIDIDYEAHICPLSSLLAQGIIMDKVTLRGINKYLMANIFNINAPAHLPRNYAIAELHLYRRVRPKVGIIYNYLKNE